MRQKTLLANILVIKISRVVLPVIMFVITDIMVDFSRKAFNMINNV